MGRWGRSSSLKVVGMGVLASTTLVALSLTAGTASAAGNQGSGQLEPVSGGINPAVIPGTTVFGNTPPSTPETVSFVLTEQNLPQLESSVEHGAQQYLSVPQFAQEYGQSPYNIAQLQRYLGAYGITTQVYPDDVDVSASGTAGQFDAALSVQQHQYGVPRQAAAGGRAAIPAQTVHGTGQAPLLPAYLASFVTAILGLDDYSSFASEAQHINTTGVSAQPGNANACLALVGLPNACNTTQNFAANYGLTPLYRQRAEGQGQTVGIVTLAALDVGAAQYFWQNIDGIPNTGRTVTVDNIDGGPGAPSLALGSSETDLDVEQSGGVAPAANVVVYQAPNTDPGFADAFFTAASQNIAGSVSTSWGESETYLAASIASGAETSGYMAAFDEAFLELAAQGQSAFAAAGDAGAYDADDDLGTTNLAADTPANSPFITAGGGTTLPTTASLTGPDGTATFTVPQQRAWGWDYLWAAVASITGTSLAAVATDPSNLGGAGGGFSTIEPEPSYQQGVSGTSTFDAVPYLTPTDYQNFSGLSLPTSWNFNGPTPPVVRGQGSGRALPDLAVDADPETGYLEWSPAFAAAGQPELQGGWGGTSFVGPQLNGSTAVIESALGHRIGFWNPTMYAAAQQRFQSPFTPLQQPGTGNDNLYYTGAPGAVFNEATGLGLPNLSALAGNFAGG